MPWRRGKLFDNTDKSQILSGCKFMANGFHYGHNRTPAWGMFGKKEGRGLTLRLALFEKAYGSVGLGNVYGL